MEDHPQDDTCLDSTAVPVDHAILAALLDMGDREMRHELRLQLDADLRRIASSFDAENRESLAAAAHELKGLSATMGAMRLSENAQTLVSVAMAADTTVLEVMARTIRQEIYQLLGLLESLDPS